MSGITTELSYGIIYERRLANASSADCFLGLGESRMHLKVHVRARRGVYWETGYLPYHSFAIPSLGIKIDAMAGRINAVSVYINRPGVFVRLLIYFNGYT